LRRAREALRRILRNCTGVSAPEVFRFHRPRCGPTAKGRRPAAPVATATCCGAARYTRA
jgi:hypothetical protein